MNRDDLPAKWTLKIGRCFLSFYFGDNGACFDDVSDGYVQRREIDGGDSVGNFRNNKVWHVVFPWRRMVASVSWAHAKTRSRKVLSKLVWALAASRKASCVLRIDFLGVNLHVSKDLRQLCRVKVAVSGQG